LSRHNDYTSLSHAHATAETLIVLISSIIQHPIETCPPEFAMHGASGVTREDGGGGGLPRVTPYSGDTRPKINFLWLNLERTLDNRGGKMEVVWKKGCQIFSRKNRVTLISCHPG